MMGLLLLIASLAPAARAQQTPQQNGNPEGTESQSQNGMDCFGPLLAATPECIAQSEEETNPLLTPQSRNSQPGEYRDQSRNPSNNYTDTENLTRQQSNRNQPLPVKLPPEPPTEFQRFVGSTIGQVLPIYGASLFASVPSTFAPLDMTPVPPDYVLGPGDELRIRVWGQVNFQSNVRVDRSGEIFLPQVGPVHVSEIPFSALNAHLRGAVGRVYRNFDLTADVGQIRSVQVYVAGAARRPGVYTVSALSSLVDALFASGGPTVQGSMRQIQLRRGSAVVTEFDLYGLLIHGDKSKDVKLQSGDVIFISPAGPQAAVTGSVRNPAIYELRKNETLASLLADAGGVTSVAAEARVSIERIENHRDRSAMEVAYDANGLATLPADGDLVRVFSIVPLYRKTVILRGNAANPGRFAWHPGMRVSELIPDRESLITRNYWWKRAQLGQSVPEFDPIQGYDNLRQPAENRAIPIKALPLEDASTANQALNQNQSVNPAQNQYQSYPNANQAQNQNLSADQRSGSTTLAAAQSSSVSRVPLPAQRTEIKALAPEIDWNYAAIERLDPETLKNTVIPFDLGKLVLQHDGSLDLELQAGDVVTIFSEADIRVPIAQQTKLVTLGGEFVHAGVYTVQPGETFRHLAERAGGLTPDAYLYGSELTRESTRAVQQARIDEYVQSLSMGIQRSSLAMSASPASSAQDMASAAAAQNSERDLLAALRQIRATGRIVLRFAPDSSGTSSFPEITMEDGDRFIVPPVPATINVVGAVYDQNSFLYARGIRAGDYLKQAGGPNRDADRSHAFIIRADGEVVSHDKGRKAWGGSGFDSQFMSPGDTIVVPDKTYKPSALRGFVDWSQMFSQFALGAAALSVLK
jgi:protein involved in polysaccharide export with SLBB domain